MDGPAAETGSFEPKVLRVSSSGSSAYLSENSQGILGFAILFLVSDKVFYFVMAHSCIYFVHTHPSPTTLSRL